MKIKIKIFIGSIILLSNTLSLGFTDQNLEYKVSGSASGTESYFSLSQLEARMEVKVIKSTYFDRALSFKNSQLHVISFS